VRIRDPRETSLPAVGLVQWIDAESGHTSLVDTSSAATQDLLRERVRHHDMVLDRRFRAHSVDLVDVDVTRSYVEPLQQFFAERAGRVRRGRR